MLDFLLILSIYFIGFTNKPGVSTPALSERALEQRARWEIALDSLDYPVSPLYLDSLRSIGCKVMHTSRWMNGATVSMSGTTKLEAVRACSFVNLIEETRQPFILTPGFRPAPARRAMLTEDPVVDQQTQIRMLGLDKLHEAGFEGQGIRLAVIDGGFSNADILPAFDSVRSRILGAYDFTDDADDIYGSTGDHGTSCLSIIAGIREGYRGAAVGAEYVMIRSEEYETESPKEMDNLVAALELADSLGVNISSISLGYYSFDNTDWNYVYEQMNGLSSRASRAATIAARKGMLVCVAAGNEADKPWHYIDIPADADSILTVGAVDERGQVTGFSSRGPAADGRVKPEVCAMGGATYVIRPDNEIRRGNGTSYATPVLAGMAASLWSALPELSAMQIRERIIRSASQYNTPDSDYGYGIPDAWEAYQTPATIMTTTQSEDRPVKRLVNGRLVIYVQGKEVLWY